MDSPSAPAAPDPVATANAQTQSNDTTARLSSQLNNPNVVTPYGTQTVTWGQGSNPDQPTVTQSLSPQQQQLLDAQQNLSLQMAGIGQTGLNSIGDTLSQPVNGASGQAASDQAYKAYTARLDPQWQQAGAQQDTQLRNQGLVPGGEAYDNAMRVFNQGKNDAYSQANLSAMSAAPQMQQMDIAGRDALLNELNAVRTGSQVSTPQFQQYSPTQVQPTNTLAAQQMYNGGLMNNYNAGVGSANSFNSGLMSTAATVAPMFMMAASDRRLKSNIERVGTHPLGIGIYEYDIFGHRERGVMAQEVLAVKPEAVGRHPSGYLMVDYGRL